MIIDIEKLEAMGIEVEYNEDKKIIDLHNTQSNVELYKMARQIATKAEFTDLEMDELTNTIYKIQMVKAVKYSAGW